MSTGSSRNVLSSANTTGTRAQPFSRRRRRESIQRPTGAGGEGVSRSEDVIMFLHLSDIHLDRQYSEVQL